MSIRPHFILAIGMIAALSPASFAKPANRSVKAIFIVTNAVVKAGQSVYVVGDQPALGKWDPTKGLALHVHGRGKSAIWTGATVLPSGSPVQYKYVRWDGKTADWEADEDTKSKNREVRTPSSGPAIFNDHSFKAKK